MPHAQMITEADAEFAAMVLTMVPGSFLGGSYVVKGADAGDIDVIIPHKEWPQARAALHGRIEKVRKELPTEEEDAGRELDDDRLVTVYRRGSVDLIVVADAFIESYRKAISTMVADKPRFAERPARVAVHIYYADEVRIETGRLLEAELKAKRGHGSGEYKQ